MPDAQQPQTNPQTPSPTDQDLQKELARLRLLTEIEEEKKKLAAARKPETPPAADPELEKAKRASTLAEELKKVREALPAPEAKALEGKVTIDEKVSIESATLAYESLAKIAAEIARAVEDAGVTEVVIHHEKDIAALLELRAFRAQARAIRKAYEDATPKPAVREALSAAALVGTAALAVTGVKTLIDLLALFRTDVDIKGKEIAIEDAALVAAVASGLRAGIRVFYPQIQPLDFSSSASSAESQVVTTLDDLYAARDSAEQAVNQAIADLETQVQDAEARKALAEDLKAPLTKADALFQPFRDALLKTDEATGMSALNRLLRAEILEKRLAGRHLLYLKSVKAEGSYRTTRNLFTGSRLSYSGAAIVTYLLFHPDGAIAASGTLYHHTGYREFGVLGDQEFPIQNFRGR